MKIERESGMVQNGEILRNINLQNDYFQVDFYAPEICQTAQSGQFVHVKIANLRDRILRRPFSINDCNPETGTLTVTYKVVGEGTKVLSELPAGSVCDLLGPLGKAYTMPGDDEVPVLVGGGYGSAAMYLLAKHSRQKAILLLGARSEADLILRENYAACGAEVRVATDDGSVGLKGRVTELIAPLLEEAKQQNWKPRFYGCGPGPMLRTLAKILLENHYGDSEISLDHVMCCGVGACFACVVKVKDGDTWRYARSCSEGPVFRADEIYLED